MLYIGSERMTLLTSGPSKIISTMMIRGMGEEHAPCHSSPLFPRRTSIGPLADGPVLINQNSGYAPYGRKEVRAAESTLSSVPERLWFRISYGCYQSTNMVGSGYNRPRSDAQISEQLAF
jgi:hypothetical protein